ncbi:MAG TPA: hypothetical protein VI653_05710 [Steroidobacteraceae bacterium]
MLEKGVCEGGWTGARKIARSVRRGAKPGAFVGRVAGFVMIALSLTGCSHLPSMHWPWHHKATPPPPQVHELDETSDGGAAVSFPQYWMRNTLIVDLQGASGSGNVVLKPREGTAWPVRIAFKVMPGSIGELEVRAAQRTVLPVTTQGAKPIVLELSPGIYVSKSPQISVSWGPSPTPAVQSASSG